MLPFRLVRVSREELSMLRRVGTELATRFWEAELGRTAMGLHPAHKSPPNPSSPRTQCHAFQRVNSHFLLQLGQGSLALLNWVGIGGGHQTASGLPPILLFLVARPTSLQDNLLTAHTSRSTLTAPASKILIFPFLSF